MTKKYVMIIAGILFFGSASFLIFHGTNKPNEQTVWQPDDNIAVASDNQTMTASKRDDVRTAAPKDASTGGMQAFLQDSIQESMALLTDQETAITAIGDSLTQGVGDDVVDGGYVGILEKRIKEENDTITLTNYGKRGNRSDQLLDRLDEPEIVRSIEDADIVLVTIGANDIMQVIKEHVTNLKLQQFTKAKRTYQDNLQNIFDTITDMNPDAHVFLLGIYNPFLHDFGDIDELNTIVDDWNETGKDITEAYDQATFIPIADLFASGETDLFADDHFHPNHKGYQLMAKRVLEYVADD